jgi:hypothetical protein
MPNCWRLPAARLATPEVGWAAPESYQILQRGVPINLGTTKTY